MSVPSLVQAFYERIWNSGDLADASDLLSEDFIFRGSLGNELRGRDAFLQYVRSVWVRWRTTIVRFWIALQKERRHLQKCASQVTIWLLFEVSNLPGSQFIGSARRYLLWMARSFLNCGSWANLLHLTHFFGKMLHKFSEHFKDDFTVGVRPTGTQTTCV